MKIEVNIPDGISGDWSVESFKVKEQELSQMISIMKYGRGVPAGNYKRLMRNGTCVMVNHYGFTIHSSYALIKLMKLAYKKYVKSLN